MVETEIDFESDIVLEQSQIALEEVMVLLDTWRIREFLPEAVIPSGIAAMVRASMLASGVDMTKLLVNGFIEACEKEACEKAKSAKPEKDNE